MKVLLLKWNSYGDVEDTLKRRGNDVFPFAIDTHAEGDRQNMQESKLTAALSDFAPDYVFSYNYFPWVSEICSVKDVKYVSWVYDSPYFDLYHFSVINPVNYIFVFDFGIYEEFQKGGIPTVYYLPMAVDEVRFEQNRAISSSDSYSKYRADVAFVGSLYTEKKHRLYDKFDAVSPYAKGYLDAITASQKLIYGMNFLEEMLTDEIEKEMQKAYHCDSNTVHAMSPKKLYSQFVLSRHVTRMEREDVLGIIGKSNKESTLVQKLYTNEESVSIPGWINLGPVDYYKEMPFVFANSKINLNISLRSILTGIPLRAFDIMGMGGFLLTNYQIEFDNYFVRGEDYDYYESYEDLALKVDYYLSHDKERKEIAENGHRKVISNHTLDNRFETIESIIKKAD